MNVQPSHRCRNARAALILVAPFVAVYAVLFVYPTLQMVWTSLTKQGLIVPGAFVGLANYQRLVGDARFWRAAGNTATFVGMTVIPGTLLGLMLALMVNRLKGWVQGLVLATLFLPYMLPVSTVVLIWQWVIYWPLQAIWPWFFGKPLQITSQSYFVLPLVAVITVWWTAGFNVLIFVAGLKAIPPELSEAARIDGAGPMQRFISITWPLIWPVTVLVLTIQLIWQIKVFDQVYLFAQGTRPDASIVLVQYIYLLAFQQDKGGYAATVAVALVLMVLAISVLQMQVRRLRGALA